MQKRCNSIALAMELRLFCIKLSNLFPGTSIVQASPKY